MLNGIAGASNGSSTNWCQTLCCMAIAHEAGVELTLEDFDCIGRRQVPFVCNLQPSGIIPSYPGCQRRDAVLRQIESRLHGMY